MMLVSVLRCLFCQADRQACRPHRSVLLPLWAFQALDFTDRMEINPQDINTFVGCRQGRDRPDNIMLRGARFCHGFDQPGAKVLNGSLSQVTWHSQSLLDSMVMTSAGTTPPTHTHTHSTIEQQQNDDPRRAACPGFPSLLF